MKKKTYVLTVSKVFLSGHPRAGEPTNFRQQILDGKKIHTIRAGDYWRKVVEEVNAGLAVLSVREWSGKPYNSKQVEFARYEKLGWQKILIDFGRNTLAVNTTGCKFSGVKDKLMLASNDGLTLSDFEGWFGKPFFGGIIHFTDFRY